MGDGIVIAVIGLVLGFRRCLAVVSVASLEMCAAAIVVLLFKKGNRRTQLAFLPALFVGYVLCGAGGWWESGGVCKEMGGGLFYGGSFTDTAGNNAVYGNDDFSGILQLWQVYPGAQCVRGGSQGNRQPYPDGWGGGRAGAHCCRQAGGWKADCHRWCFIWHWSWRWQGDSGISLCCQYAVCHMAGGVCAGDWHDIGH